MKVIAAAEMAQENGDEAAVTLPTDLRFHDLRHTCAALLIANGRHMEEVKDYLGHSSILVTSDRYGHLFPHARQERADSLDRLFHPANGTSDELSHAPLRAPCGHESPDERPEERNEAPEGASDQQIRLERTTGFEPATLTLAR